MNRILLLEDDVSLIDGLVYSLKKNEFDVEVARTVCEAKQYLSELDRYDLLILDVTLPDGTGFDVCERVRKEKQQIGIFIFFWKRKRLYQQADKILLNYINGDYSCHLPQNYEGAIYQVFSSIEQLATMLQSKNETERKAKEFLKDTISDISHQLKTPLAALTMYQEIIESEPENAETVKQFAAKMGISLKRMEQLILSMLKITRLDTGNIIFEKKSCRVSELIAHSVNDLTTRAKSESKQIQIDGDGEQQLICDMEWTGEAIGNIVKNALDHTQAGGIVRITWERTPAMFRIFISDNGNGIVPEDIYHIFKRFYRSKHSLDTQGIGLGLPLAKSIIEGQNGVISVQSEVGKGTLFTLSFLTDL